jgi:hypothetical protein
MLCALVRAQSGSMEHSRVSVPSEHTWQQVNILLDRFPSNYYKSVDVDAGWHQIVINCNRELAELDPYYVILQIKQKFGGLRYYFEPSEAYDGVLFAKMNAIVLKYERAAAVTCEATGNPGVLMKSTSGRLKTLDPQWTTSTLFFRNYSIVEKTPIRALEQEYNHE